MRRYPLDKSRYEVMLEVTNTGEETLDVELSLFGDGQLNDLTRLRLHPHEKLPGWKGQFWKRLAPPGDPFTLARDHAPLLFDPGEKFQTMFDAGQAAAYMQLAAWELGVGSCLASIYEPE